MRGPPPVYAIGYSAEAACLLKEPERPYVELDGLLLESGEPGLDIPDTALSPSLGDSPRTVPQEACFRLHCTYGKLLEALMLTFISSGDPSAKGHPRSHQRRILCY